VKIGWRTAQAGDRSHRHASNDRPAPRTTTATATTLIAT
jgi:hypothetical protein